MHQHVVGGDAGLAGIEELAPGDAIVIHFRDGDVVALDWINAPSNLAT